MFDFYGNLEMEAEFAENLEDLVKPIAENESTNNTFQNIGRGLRGISVRRSYGESRLEFVLTLMPTRTELECRKL